MKKQFAVAIIEDDYDDFLFLKESFQKFYPCSFHHFTRGGEFFNFMDCGGNDKVDLTVIDLNLPEIGGVEIVKTIKENPLLNSIPVLVLTTGGTPSEKEICKKLHVEIFRKPCSIKEWESMAVKMASLCDPALIKSQIKL